MLYKLTDGFSDAFSMFMLMDFKQDQRPVIVTNKVNEVEMYKELYLKYFFSTNVDKVKIKREPNEFFDEVITAYKNPVFQNRDLFLRNVKDKTMFNKKEHYCYSLASNRKSYKGMDDEMMEYIKPLLVNGTDLGNSRNFESFEQMEQKFLTLCSSKFFIGSEVSWSIFCSFFKIPCMHLFQFVPYMSTKRVEMNDLTFSVDPHMVIG